MNRIEDEEENEDEDDFLSVLRMHWDHVTWERRHPCRRVPQSVEWPAGMPALPGGSWKASFCCCACIGIMKLIEDEEENEDEDDSKNGTWKRRVRMTLPTDVYSARKRQPVKPVAVRYPIHKTKLAIGGLSGNDHPI